MDSATQNHGVLRPEVLDLLAITSRQRQYRVKTGQWHRLPCGILVVAGVPETFAMHRLAAHLACPAGVTASVSAAAVHDIERPDGPGWPVDLAVAANARSRLGGVRLHRMDLAGCEITRRDGLRVTTVERTLVDLASTWGTAPLRRAVDQQLADRRSTFDRIEAAFARVAGSGRPGTVRMRAVLSDIDGEPPTESELEAQFVRLCCSAGLPAAERQLKMEWMERERGRVDFFFRDAGLIVEVDGRRFHTRSDAFERDRRRDQQSLMAGYRTVRFTWRQVTDEPQWVRSVMRSLVGEDSSCR